MNEENGNVKWSNKRIPNIISKEKGKKESRALIEYWQKRCYKSRRVTGLDTRLVIMRTSFANVQYLSWIFLLWNGFIKT